MVDFRPRIKILKTIPKGVRSRDRIRILLYFVLSLFPKRVRIRFHMMNKAVKGVIVYSMDKRFVVNTFDNFYHIDPYYEDQIYDWFEVGVGEDVIDAGANIGRWSLLLADKTFGTVLALEPLHDTFISLCQNVKMNHAKNVIPVNVGLSDKADISRMRITQFSGRNSLILDKYPAIGSEDVLLDSLDSLLTSFDLPMIGLIKIDVEGYEVPALHGMTNTLLEHKPRVIIEVVKKNVLHVVQFMEYLGYYLADNLKNDYLFLIHGEIGHEYIKHRRKIIDYKRNMR